MECRIVHKGEASLLVVVRRGGEGAAEGATQGAGRVQLRGRPARGHGVHAALHARAHAAAHQVHAHLAQVLSRAGVSILLHALRVKTRLG